MFKGYVLQSELAQKSNKSLGLFRQLKGLEFKKMTYYTCIKIDSLPPKYQKIAKEECLDLEFWWSFTFLSLFLGMGEDYIAQVERSKKLDSIKIGGVKLFKLNTEFLENIKQGLTAFKIVNQDDLEYADSVIDLQCIKVGFY